MKPSGVQIQDARDHSKVLYDNSRTFDLQTGSTPGSLSHNDLSQTILDELHVAGFDAEQIWQQIDHRFNVLTDEGSIAELTKTLTDTSLGFLTSTLSGRTLPDGNHDAVDCADGSDESAVDDEDSEAESTLSESDEEMDEGEDEEEESEEGDGAGSNQVEDKFFSFKRMEALLDQQDADLLKNPDQFERMPEMYESDGSDSEDHHYMYSDLFGKLDGKSVLKKKAKIASSETAHARRERNPFGDMEPDYDEDDNLEEGEMEVEENLSDDDLELIKALDEEMATGEGEESGEEETTSDQLAEESGDESDDAEHLQDVIGRQKHEPSKSEYEKRTEKLRGRISAMEEAALSDKPWQLKGEVTAKTRPENSLIQEDVEFDSNVAPVPVVTMETTQNLEALIIQRIKDKAFDDVERKTRLKEDGERFKKRIELDHEKSKQSLSQIYEQEYLKLRDNQDDDEEKEDPQEAAIKKMMASLFSKLDALSSFHYTPKPAPPDIKIISHLPAVVVEEVQPSSVADSARLAPEEVKKPKVEAKVRSEMDETDKKRIRRQKKAKHRKVENVKKTIESRVKKINPGLGNKRAEQRSIEAIKQAVVNEGRIIKPSKESVLPDKTYSSSKEFFKALQSEVKLDKKLTRKKADTSKKWVTSKSAEKLKL